jgi:hypothetical protein
MNPLSKRFQATINPTPSEPPESLVIAKYGIDDLADRGQREVSGSAIAMSTTTATVGRVGSLPTKEGLHFDDLALLSVGPGVVRVLAREAVAVSTAKQVAVSTTKQ